MLAVWKSVGSDTQEFVQNFHNGDESFLSNMQTLKAKIYKASFYKQRLLQ